MVYYIICNTNGILYLDSKRSAKNIYAYFMVLELQTANIKIADLETKIQGMEEEKKEQNHSELLFSILYCMQY